MFLAHPPAGTIWGRPWFARLLLVLVLIITFTACEDNAGSNNANNDAGTDGGNDAGLTCGNGQVDPGEQCDTAIAQGEPGACPAACIPEDTCSTTLLTGSGCQARCLHGLITNTIQNDGCCPVGANLLLDVDCAASCGNDVVEPGETCDPPDSCPTACDDGNLCTTDSLVGEAGSCTAACEFTPIVSCIDDDGCCAPGCDATQDNDCPSTCGNDIVEPGETCDPAGSCPSTCGDADQCTTDQLVGNPETCDATCTHTIVTACVGGDGCCPTGCHANNDSDCTPVCGNGTVEAGETCDPPGSCPTSCFDGDPCTEDLLGGDAANCNVSCSFPLIVTCSGTDGCCPTGCNAVNDSDCSANCGNGVVEPGETCDPPGTCPSTCADTDPCTTDTLTGSAANCNATCTHTAITSCANGDGCCPGTCNTNGDNDCAPVCGNNAVEPGETCDPPGSCPTSCGDGDACTDDVLTGSAATCDVACSFPSISTCTSGDGCCPGGCFADTDGDCIPVCGNSVVEPGEECDDGNLIAGDGCDGVCLSEGNGDVAYRVDWMELRDPHLFYRIFFTCSDITSNVNDQMADSINNDTDDTPDGILNLSLVIITRPLEQSTPYTGNADIAVAACTDPPETTVCDEDPATPIQATQLTNTADGTCLAPYPGTTGGYNPPVEPTVAPPVCLATTYLDVVLNLGGVLVVMHDTEVSATYVGDPAESLISGMLRGFIPYDEAQTTMVDLGFLGTHPLSDLLRPDACGDGDDMDVGLDGSTPGWWFYLNFTAVEVPWVGP